MSILEAIINGIVQGLTEFLPVSSSGHLSLIQYFTGRAEETGLFFTILLHLGTLASVFIAFRKMIWELIVEFFVMLGDIFKGKFSLKRVNPQRKMIFLIIVSLFPMIFSFFMLDYFDKVATDNSIITEGFGFLLTSLLLFVSVKTIGQRKTMQDMNYKDALLIGGMQAIAPIPGISRSGSTIAVGMLCGLDREFAIAFSFIMGIPTVLGANVLEISGALKEGMKIPMPILMVGIITSFIFGLLAIKMVKWLSKKNRFLYFSAYTFVLGILTVIIGIYEKLNGNPIQQYVSALIR